MAHMLRFRNRSVSRRQSSDFIRLPATRSQTAEVSATSAATRRFNLPHDRPDVELMPGRRMGAARGLDSNGCLDVEWVPGRRMGVWASNRKLKCLGESLASGLMRFFSGETRAFSTVAAGGACLLPMRSAADQQRSAGWEKPKIPAANACLALTIGGKLAKFSLPRQSIPGDQVGEIAADHLWSGRVISPNHPTTESRDPMGKKSKRYRAALKKQPAEAASSL